MKKTEICNQRQALRGFFIFTVAYGALIGLGIAILTLIAFLLGKIL